MSFTERYEQILKKERYEGSFTRRGVRDPLQRKRYEESFTKRVYIEYPLEKREV